ncbi:MAG TPA: VIT domain-containing protein [Verrucomicrobiae bacterium]|jgi:Ca-activated chloride channel family protein|nr:VIT domain-containing protein [Verrucomicrobiae bacterium]
MKRFMLLPVLLCCSILHAKADGLIIVHPGPGRPPAPYAFAPLEITYHHVNVKINGQIATTTVDQEFYNPNPQRLEGTYIFPVPKGAQIDKFTMEIGGKQVEAELLAADKARSIYEDIVRKLRDPALLEYEGRDVFKMRVFPIEPNSPKRIQLSYSQVLASDSGLISYVYPLNTEKFSAKPIKNVSVKVELDSPKALKTIYSPSHAVEIKRDGAHRATASYEASEVRPDTDFALYFAPENDEVGVNLLTCKSAGEDGYFLLLASPGVETKSAKPAPKDVAFVLDTSGSMVGKKIEQAKKALQFCVENLNDSDRFEVVRFSTDVEPLFGKLTEATRQNRERAESFVQDLKAVGGTAIDDALRQVLTSRPAKDDRPFMIVFLTDGEPTVGETDEDTIVAHVKKEGEGRTRVFCFGIGGDVNTHLLDKIAEETRAAAQYVLPEEDLEVKVSSFFSKITEPVLANPALHVTGGVHISKMYPEPLPDLFKGGQLIVVGRYTGDGAAGLEIAGTINGQSRKFAQDVKFSADSPESEFIPRLWATRRVGYLLDEIRLHGENAELRDEVTQLARRYGIVTPYTAYLIIEDEARRNVPLSMQSLPRLNADSAAHQVAAQNWSAFKARRGGRGALADARYGSTLRLADSPGVAAASSAFEANLALGLPGTPVQSISTPSTDSRERVAQYTQQTRFVNGKNFFQNQDQQWIDSDVQNLANAKRVRVQFDSEEYFALAAREPHALPWLALGRNVQFALDGTVYEVYE